MKTPETVSVLLNEALAPYQVELQTQVTGALWLVMSDRAGEVVLQREVRPSQLQDQRLLVDLVDGLQRDLRIAEGRLEPCVIAAQRHVAQGAGVGVNG